MTRMSHTQTVLTDKPVWPASFGQATFRYRFPDQPAASNGVDFSIRMTSFYGCHDALVVGFGEQLGYVDDSRLRRPDLRAFGREFYRSPEHAGRRYIRSIKMIEAASLDTLTVVDTCEHLDDAATHRLFAEAARTLKPDGCFIVSIAVGRGLSAASRQPRARAARHAHEAHADEVRSTTHFRLKTFTHSLNERFIIDAALNRPWSMLPCWLNSRRIMVCRTRVGK